VLREAFRIDRRRRDDDLEVRSSWEKLLEIPEEEVDVQASFVRLVDDDRVVAPQLPIPLDLRQQDAVGHHLDLRRVARPVGESDLVADELAEFAVELGSDAFGDGPRRDPARLGVTDRLALGATSQFQADLRELGGLAAPRLPGDDDDLVLANRSRDVVPALRDRKLGRITDP
jgi:hypothetical protein